MKDQHPVKFLVDLLADGGIYEPLKEWVLSKTPGFCLPGGSVVPVSLLCFALEEPIDGFPILEEWASTARDIFHGGWENHRQPVEIRLTEKAVAGSALSFASLLPSKGFARLSILLFGLAWSYQNKEKLSNDQNKDFERHRGGKWLDSVKTVVEKLSNDQNKDFERHRGGKWLDSVKTVVL
eukprot:s4758_g4.t1